MDISGKAPLMFYSFSVANDTDISYSNSLGGEPKFRREAVGLLGWDCVFRAVHACVSLCDCVHPCLCANARMCTLSVSTDSAHLLLIHAFSPF